MPRRETKSVVPAVPRDGKVVSVALESLGDNTFVVAKDLPDSLGVVRKVYVVRSDDDVIAHDTPLNSVERGNKTCHLDRLIESVDEPNNVELNLLARAGENEEIIDVWAVDDDAPNLTLKAPTHVGTGADGLVARGAQRLRDDGVEVVLKLGVSSSDGGTWRPLLSQCSTSRRIAKS